MNKDKRIGWLAQLKVGDRVFVSHTYHRGPWELFKVEKVTPTGRMTVDGRVFNPHGGLVGDSSYSKVCLEQVTEESLLVKRRANLIGFIESWARPELQRYPPSLRDDPPLALLEDVVALIKLHQPKEEQEP